MPRRSFEYWYRGSSVEAAARSSTAAPWGLRGALVAPVIQGKTDQNATAAGGLRAGGSGAPAARVFADAPASVATGGAAPANASVRAGGLTALEIVATAAPRSAGARAAGGGASVAGGHVAIAALGASCEGGFGLATAIEARLAPAPTSGGCWSPGGRSPITSAAGEAASGGLSAGLGAALARVIEWSGTGGSSMGGVGPNAAGSSGRSFKYWRRGEAIVDASPRAGGFAHAYRGWIGVPSSGRVGRIDDADPEGAGLRVGGDVADMVWIDRRVAGVASIDLGGVGVPARQDHVADSGGAARPGGTAKLERGASGWTVVTASVGGELGARLDASLDAIVVVGTCSAAAPRVALEVAPASATRFGASARVGVDHGLGAFNGDGRVFAGIADAIATLEPAASGGLAIGGGDRIDRPALVYRIYSNGGLGGAVDYASPIAEVSGLEWTSEPLPAGSSFRFGVRAYDPVAGLLDENLDASVALVIDAQGRDATRVPRPPVGLRAVDQGGGRVRIEWATAGSFRFEEAATRYHVYLGWDAITDFSSPIVVLASASRGGVVATEIHDLPEGRPVTVVVRAANEFGEDGNVDSIRFAVDLVPPSRVDDLVASAAVGV